MDEFCFTLLLLWWWKHHIQIYNSINIRIHHELVLEIHYEEEYFVHGKFDLYSYLVPFKYRVTFLKSLISVLNIISLYISFNAIPTCVKKNRKVIGYSV